MEITQSPWVLTPEGEAVVLYTLRNSCGASVKVTNLGAALVAANVPDRTGRLGDVVVGSAPLLWGGVWESRTEGNRVVFSAGLPCGEGELAVETACHWSEECELEIVFSAFLSGGDAPRPLDWVPRTRFAFAGADTVLEVPDWHRNILAEAGVIVDPESGRSLTVLTSLPAIRICGSSPDAPAPARVPEIPTLIPGEHYIQKIVCRFGV